MELADAARMILSESAPHPELLRLARHSHEELSHGRTVPHEMLSEMLREAARKDVYRALRARYGVPAFDAMVVTLGREIDRTAPVPVRAR
ncbi:hypothetical protein [Actinomadura sp. WMMB 499]|uniref:hypothetical protein n=1 Tax=Actinomadura sp. WMMB 499 TaxID=1219491 RepID=UPI0012472367|nr:hypothetical protein [Actinomadura sp. WMMB 499]QFG23123.1 hypothetical protein F7P10_20350 [Actinomadura sp. WMMB 499]